MIRRLGRIGLLLAVATLAATALTACGDDDNSDGDVDATITMTEYHYDVSGDLPSGGTIRLKNGGKQFHMLGIGKLKPGKTVKEALKAIQTDSEDDDARVVDQVTMPGSFVGPGQQIDITAPDFGAGHYLLICFINVEGKDTPHFLRGMTGELTVTDKKADRPTADATYQAAPGKAITGPGHLDAGYNVLRVHRSSDGNGLEPSLIKLDDGKTVADFAKAIKVFDEGPLPKNAAALLPGKFVAGVFDYSDNEDVYLGEDLSPGTYVLVAQDTDVDNPPDIPVEKILITVS